MTRIAGKLAFAIVLAWGALAEAGVPAAARLTYVRRPGAERCPAESDFRELLVREMGYDPISPDASHAMSVVLFRKKWEVAGILELSDSKGRLQSSRTLWDPGASCADVLQAMAIFAAYELDRLKDAPAPEACPDEKPPAPCVAAAPLSAPAPPALAPRAQIPRAPLPPRAPVLRLNADLQTALALSSGEAFGGSGAVELRWRRLSVAVQARAFFPSELVSVQDRTLSLASVGGAFVPCLRDAVFFGCAVAGVEHARARAAGVEMDMIRANVGARAGVAWSPFGGVELYGAAEALVSLPATAVTDQRTGDVWSTPPVAAVIGMGASVPVAVF